MSEPTRSKQQQSSSAVYPNLQIDKASGPDGAREAVWVVTIDRPQALNAIDVPTMQALADLFADCVHASAPKGQSSAESSEAVPLRAVILTGGGDKAFVAGADIAALAAMAYDEAHAFSRLGHVVGERIGSLPVPVIAAVNGYALGGGCELALACDFIYASPSARFGMPEVRLGAIPGFGGTQRLARRIGLARASELLFTGESIDATEAMRLGVCNRVVPAEQLLAKAKETAATIAARAPLAVAAAKRAMRAVWEAPLSEGLLLESDLFGELFATSDLAAGMRAFLEKNKTPPKWQGR